jgi:hypothetical protein
MIRRDRPDVVPFRFWVFFQVLGSPRRHRGREPFRWAIFGALPSIESGRETEYTVAALIDAPSHLAATTEITDRFGRVTVIFCAPKPDGWEPQCLKAFPPAQIPDAAE